MKFIGLKLILNEVLQIYCYSLVAHSFYYERLLCSTSVVLILSSELLGNELLIVLWHVLLGLRIEHTGVVLVHLWLHLLWLLIVHLLLLLLLLGGVFLAFEDLNALFSGHEADLARVLVTVVEAGAALAGPVLYLSFLVSVINSMVVVSELSNFLSISIDPRSNSVLLCDSLKSSVVFSFLFSLTFSDVFISFSSFFLASEANDSRVAVAVLACRACPSDHWVFWLLNILFEW